MRAWPTAGRLHEYAAAGLPGLLAWHVFGPDPLDGLGLQHEA